LSWIYHPTDIRIQTREPKTDESAVVDEIKLMLSELYSNVYYGRYIFADRIPDQETFLFHLHGSKLHILRAFFPGSKSSAVYCGRKKLPPRIVHLPVPNPGKLHDNATPEEQYHHKIAQDDYQLAIREAADMYKDELGGELDMKTFRVFASREMDLWYYEDFSEAIRHVAAISLHLMSGHSNMGVLERQFWLSYRRSRWRACREGETAAEAAALAAMTTSPISDDDDDDDDDFGEGPSNSHHEHVQPRSSFSPPGVAMSDERAETTAAADENDDNNDDKPTASRTGNVEHDSPSSVSPLRAATTNEAWWKDPKYHLDE
jgi:hypothetical protein